MASANQPEGTKQQSAVPSWLSAPENYVPQRDHDASARRSALSIAAVLAQLRLDAGKAAFFSPSALTKLAVGFGVILLTSLSHNYLFVLIMLALVLVRAALLPSAALRRCAGVVAAATGLAVLVMLPAVAMGQAHAPLLIATKTVVTTATAMEVVLTTPFSQLTGALRKLRVPSVVLLTLDLALKNIVSLGQTALKMIDALTLRSVGRATSQRERGSAVGGIGGMLLVKAAASSRDTFDAMRCRGFEGDYQVPARMRPTAMDLAWLVLLACVIITFVYLQGVA